MDNMFCGHDEFLLHPVQLINQMGLMSLVVQGGMDDGIATALDRSATHRRMSGHSGLVHQHIRSPNSIIQARYRLCASFVDSN